MVMDDRARQMNPREWERMDAEVEHPSPNVAHVYISDVDMFTATGIRGITTDGPGEGARYVFGHPEADGTDRTIPKDEALARISREFRVDSDVDWRLEDATRLQDAWRLEYVYDGPRFRVALLALFVIAAAITLALYL